MNRKPAPTLEEAFGKLSDQEKRTELAKGISVADLYALIQNNERRKISNFVYDRFYRRYLMPFSEVHEDFNSGFSQMAICCLMIEAMESFRNGWNDTMEDAIKPDGSRKKGGEIFEEFFNLYDDFHDFRTLGNEFYKNVRCGILHQAEPQNGWLIERQGVLYDAATRTINSTRFRKRMRKCLKAYCSELETSTPDSDVWANFKIKMAYVVQNCKRGDMKI